MTRRWHRPTLVLVLATAILTSCEPAEPNELTPADYDSTAQAIVTTGPVRQLSAWMVSTGPLASDLKADLPGASDYTCDKINHGTCPTLSVQCDGSKTLLTVTLDYPASGGCKDSSGASVKGSILFTRNGARDWTVELKGLDRNGVVFDGKLGFKVSGLGQPWAMTITDLKVSGAASGSITDSKCTKNCVYSQTYSFKYDLAFSTGTPISIAVDLLSKKTVVMNGSVITAGTVTGHIKVTTKGPAGGEQVAVDRDENITFSNRTVSFKEVTYSVPLSCTCPTSGTVSTTSLINCGDVSASFSAGGGSCSSAAVAYTSSDKRCQYARPVVESAVNEACVPLDLK